jgi:hypothetical protein
VDPEFKKKMQNDLGTMKRNLKDFIFREGNRGMRLFDPNMDLRGMEEDNIWGDDPVHPRSETYMKIAKGIVSIDMDNVDLGPGLSPYMPRCSQLGYQDGL